MKKTSVLDLLRQSAEHFLSGEDMASQLGVSRSAVWNQIHDLQKLGYRIEARTHAGYRLLGVPDKLFADEMAWELGTRVLGRRIFSYEDIESTNDAVFRLGEQRAPEGVTVFAEHQNKGRGRLGRRWHCPRGKGILFSYLLRPSLSPSQIPQVTLVTALSVVRAIRAECGLECGIKWPNDIVYEERKLCGILTEMSAEQDRVNFVVVGIGLNVNGIPAQVPDGPASLKGILKREISRVTLAKTLLRHIDRDYLAWKAQDGVDFVEEWERASVTTGRRVTARTNERVIQGQATGIDRDGALWIRTDSGLQERILAGDVDHVR